MATEVFYTSVGRVFYGCFFVRAIGEIYMDYNGLTTEEAKTNVEKFGKNELVPKKKRNFFVKIIKTLLEPTFLLLLIASTIYFVLGEPKDGAIMLVFVIAIVCIDFFQEWKTDKTLERIKELSNTKVKALRDGEEVELESADITVGDLIFISEGSIVPADGKIVACNDLTVNESSLTGESEAVRKDVSDNSEDYWRKNKVYAGTAVIQGLATVVVEKIGLETEYGKIGKDISSAPQEKTPLQKQTKTLTKYCAILAALLFVSVSLITFFRVNPEGGEKDRIINAVLAGITLAMAMIPEEFPVILTVFLSMGAWRLAKKNALIRRLPSVETLGSISVLCVDKTGTITENDMVVKQITPYKTTKFELASIAGSGCELDAYDPMEKAIIEYCESIKLDRSRIFKGELVKEYSFSDETKMMGHVWLRNGKYCVCAKGSPESIIEICSLDDYEKTEIKETIENASKKGLRVIAVAYGEVENEDCLPEKLTDCSLSYYGFVGLYDPPRKNVEKNIEICRKAGVRVVMITGDNGYTAVTIAEQVGIDVSGGITTGAEINAMSDDELKERVKTCNVFSRVVPEHKSRIVKAFKSNGEIVAMTGDGVNDASALKYADIGIAMGKRGNEISKEAADMILLDDNFSTIVSTIEDGRRIYDNIRKAIGYVFAIHIPIAVSSLICPLLGIPSSQSLLFPLHVVLLELIIDPTCSIVLERQPEENGIMERMPRKSNEKILDAKIFAKSVFQGIFVCLASFLSYYLLLQKGYSTETARTTALSTIVFANLFLVQVNSSENDFAFVSVRKLAKDWIMWLVNALLIVGSLIIIYTPLNGFLLLSPLNAKLYFASAGLGFVSVGWYEIVKLFRKLNDKRIKKE